MARRDFFIEEAAGAATHYARTPVAPYGTRAKPHRFYLDQGFAQKLKSCLEELWSAFPCGRAEVVVSAGGWVDKVGMHSKGRAFDLDAA